MNLFLDTSVLLAAVGSANGASREIFRRALSNDWTLVATPYVIDEVVRNLPHLPPTTHAGWPPIQNQLSVMADVFTLDRPVIFGSPKDRPILFGALAWAEVLLSLDRADFGGLITTPFYGLRVLRPGAFLEGSENGSRHRSPSPVPPG